MNHPNYFTFNFNISNPQSNLTNLHHLLPMSSPLSSKLNKLASIMLDKLFRVVLYAGLLVYITYIFFFNNSWFYTHILSKTIHSNPTNPPSPPTPTHIVFGIAASATSWNSRKHYVQAWWRPNATRGYVFLEKIDPDLLPWPQHSLPPFRVSGDTSMYKQYDKHKVPQAIRMSRIISETFEMESTQDVRWFVMGDDDTVFFVDNLVDILGRYDHNKYLYIGMNSECHASNVFHSFQMAFGGAGFALSYPLARAVSANLDTCLKRYPTLYGSDHIVQSCVADLGVSITREKGFHQIDLHNDISGYLSSHPHSPLVSLHHLDQVDSIFPWLSRNESLKHLMKSAKADESRLLQQSICYHRFKNWTFSISWGYSIDIYEAIVFPSELQKPIETFTPWSKSSRPFFLFNTRLPSKDPCGGPHVLYLHSVDTRRSDYVVTRYGRGGAARACDRSADSVSAVVVFSSKRRYESIGNRRECCDVLHAMRRNAAEIKLRDCLQNEIIP